MMNGTGACPLGHQRSRHEHFKKKLFVPLKHRIAVGVHDYPDVRANVCVAHAVAVEVKRHFERTGDRAGNIFVGFVDNVGDVVVVLAGFKTSQRVVSCVDQAVCYGPRVRV